MKRTKERGSVSAGFLFKKVSVERELSDYKRIRTVVFAKKIWSVVNKFNRDF